MKRFPPLYVDLSSPEGNVFALLALVRRHMQANDPDPELDPQVGSLFREVQRQVFVSESYEEALRAINRAVKIIDTAP